MEAKHSCCFCSRKGNLLRNSSQRIVNKNLSRKFASLNNEPYDSVLVIVVGSTQTQQTDKERKVDLCATNVKFSWTSQQKLFVATWDFGNSYQSRCCALMRKVLVSSAWNPPSFNWFSLASRQSSQKRDLWQVESMALKMFSFFINILIFSPWCDPFFTLLLSQFASVASRLTFNIQLSVSFHFFPPRYLSYFRKQ